MNILFWTDGFWPRIGGVETQGLQFVCGMKERGHSCTVLAQKDHENMKGEEEYQGIPIHRFDFNQILENNDLKQIRPIKIYLEKILKEFQPDVIYLNTLGNGSAFLFLLFRKMFRMPIVATVHAPYYWDGIPPLVEQICAQVDHICCASQWGLSFMEKVIPQHRHKMRMIYYGLSLPKLVPTSLPFSPPTILLLGRLSSEKGFEIGIEAFSLLRKRGLKAQLLIAGEGAERPFLEQRVDQLGVRSCTKFIGRILRHNEEIYSVINQSTFVVMPSHFEAFGLVALESMRMARPVIASHIGGLPEIVLEKERGLLVPAQDPVAFSEAMKKLLENPEETQKMGIKAREWACQTFLLKENLDSYEALFDEAIGCPQ